MTTDPFQPDLKDLETIANWSKGPNPPHDRLEKLASSVAIRAIKTFAEEQRDVSKISQAFYLQVLNKLDLFKSFVSEVDSIRYINQSLLQLLKQHQLIPCPAIDELSKLEFKGDITLFIKQSQELRMKLAKFYAQFEQTFVAQQFHWFEIHDLNSQIEIVKTCSQARPKTVVKHFTGFRIQDDQARFELAMFLAQTVPKKVATHIRNFNIQDEKNRMILTRLLAQTAPQEVTTRIEIFDIQDETVRIELARLLAQTAPQEVATHIENFDIQNETVRIELANLLTQTAPKEVANHIQDFNIQDETLRIKLAKMLAQTAPEEVASCIQDFNIQDEAIRIELVMLLAQTAPKEVANHIQDFNIQDETLRIKLARMLAQTAPEEVASCIQDFNIQDEAIRIELVMLLAQTAPKEVANHIQDFNIQDETLRIKLARMLAQIAPEEVTNHIEDFNIQDETFRIELAQLLALAAPEEVANYIQNFNIQDEPIRIELAKLLALTVPHEIATSIENFKIQSKAARIEIATICAKQNGVSTITHLDQFDLPETEKGSIALICLKQNEDCINNFPQELTELSLSAFQSTHQPPATLPTEISQRQEAIRQFLSRKKIQISESLAVFLAPFAQLPQETEEEAHVRQSRLAGALKMLGVALVIMEKELSSSQIKTSLSDSPFTAILHLPRPDLKWPLMMQAVEAVKNPPIQLRPFEKKGLWKTILSMLLTRCSAQKICTIDIADKIVNISKHSLFKDGKNHQMLLEALLLLVQHENLDAQTKQALLIKLLDFAGSDTSGNTSASSQQTQTAAHQAHNFNQRVGYLLAVLAMNNKNVLNSPSGKNLADMVQQSFQELVPLEHIHDFSQKYFNAFGASRAPYAIITYAAKLNLLKDPRVLKDLAVFIKGVLNHTSVEQRHVLSQNPHLQKIQTTHPHILAQWLQPLSSMPLSDLGKETHAKFSYEEWLMQKLITDRHISHLEKKEPYLFCHLTKQPTSEPISPLSTLILQLIHEKDEKSILEILSKMHDLPSVQGTEFASDIEGAILSIKNKKIIAQHPQAVVIDTEDPIDLLLCGTEVAGSCQRISGAPSLSKGLLGYLLDGKIRMIAVKSKPGPDGKILGRALLKLLWDGEKPVLYLERLYLNSRSSLLEKAIFEMAKRKSKQLGLELVTSQGKGGKYEKPLQSLGGPATFEYSDANNGNCLAGKYTIASSDRI